MAYSSSLKSSRRGVMSRATVEQVIRRFGSQQRVAELLGIWQTAVSGWLRRGAIPARRQDQLLRIARREGIALRPADFFGDGHARTTRAFTLLAAAHDRAGDSAGAERVRREAEQAAGRGPAPEHRIP